MANPSIRLLRADDEISPLTDLLHRAYAPLAARGLRYVATHQDDAETRRRCGRGECLVAEEDGRIVATVTWHRPDAASPCAWYRRSDVAIFGQYAVEPSLQGRGVGHALVREVERRAVAAGFTELACDTASPAAHLIALYERWGFRLVDRVRWTGVNYESVVLSKRLSRDRAN